MSWGVLVWVYFSNKQLLQGLNSKVHLKATGGMGEGWETYVQLLGGGGGGGVDALRPQAIVMVSYSNLVVKLTFL